MDHSHDYTNHVTTTIVPNEIKATGHTSVSNEWKATGKLSRIYENRLINDFQRWMSRIS